MKLALIDKDMLTPVVVTLLEALMTDGAHHKQWLIERALLELCTNEWVDTARNELQWEKGVAP